MALIDNWHFLEEEFFANRKIKDDAYMTYNNYEDKLEVQKEKQLKCENFLM